MPPHTASPYRQNPPARHQSAFRNRLVGIVAKAAITCAFLYLLVSGIDIAQLPLIVSSVRLSTLLLAIGMHLVVFILGGLRWWMLARTAGIDRPFAAVFPSYYLGVFFNNFLPTGVGGDVVRIVHLNRRAIDLRALVASTISDRFIGLAAVMATGMAALAAMPGVELTRNTRLALAGAAATVPFTVYVVASRWFGRFVARQFERFRSTRVRSFVLEIVQSLHRLRNHGPLVLAAIGISVVVQSLVTVSYYIIARDIGIEYPLLFYFAVVPVVFLAATLPISLGGLGVREGTFVALMVAAGAEQKLAVSVSVVYLAVLWISTLPGALGLLNRPNPNART